MIKKVVLVLFKSELCVKKQKFRFLGLFFVSLEMLKFPNFLNIFKRSEIKDFILNKKKMKYIPRRKSLYGNPPNLRR